MSSSQSESLITSIVRVLNKIRVSTIRVLRKDRKSLETEEGEIPTGSRHIFPFATFKIYLRFAQKVCRGAFSSKCFPIPRILYKQSNTYYKQGNGEQLLGKDTLKRCYQPPPLAHFQTFQVVQAERVNELFIVSFEKQHGLLGLLAAEFRDPEQPDVPDVDHDGDGGRLRPPADAHRATVPHDQSPREHNHLRFTQQYDGLASVPNQPQEAVGFPNFAGDNIIPHDQPRAVDLQHLLHAHVHAEGDLDLQLRDGPVQDLGRVHGLQHQWRTR